jgi:hypothetical protein
LTTYDEMNPFLVSNRIDNFWFFFFFNFISIELAKSTV